MRKKLQELKRSVLIQLRHNADEDFDEESVLNDENDSILMKEEPSIFGVFFTLQGICILISFGVFLSLNYLLDNLTGESGRKVKTKIE
jgi:hypothetical protein